MSEGHRMMDRNQRMSQSGALWQPPATRSRDVVVAASKRIPTRRANNTAPETSGGKRPITRDT